MEMFRDPLSTRIVITGLGTINPIGATVSEFWQSLMAGKSGVRLVRNPDIAKFSVKIGGEVDLPDLTGYFKKTVHDAAFGPVHRDGPYRGHPGVQRQRHQPGKCARPLRRPDRHR